jgi:hypothetical protein
LFALGSACGSDAPAGDQGEGATTTAAVDDDDGGDGSVTTYAPKIDIPGDDSPSDPTTGLPPLLCPAGGVLDDLLVLITDGRADERATLEGVSVVGGDLHVVGASDADVDFLECLDEVRGEILIDDNRGLVDLAGTSGIEMIGSDLTISRNPALVDLEGFSVLGQIASQDPNTNERFPAACTSPKTRRWSGSSASSTCRSSTTTCTSPAIPS